MDSLRKENRLGPFGVVSDLPSAFSPFPFLPTAEFAATGDMVLDLKMLNPSSSSRN